MNTKFRRFKTVATHLNLTSMMQCHYFRGFDEVLHVLGYVQRKSALCTTLGL